jgi:signal transduction histidine kinase/AmiR/NasT family two-component response regulator
MRASTVLVIEDNPIARKMTRLALEAERYVVHEAADGAEAIAAVQAAVPDLILQDIKLPDINGVDLVGRLRALPGGDTVPIIAITGFRSELEHARSAMAGFNEILFKPVEPSVLARIVRAHLHSPDAAPVPSESRARLLLVDDDAVQLKLGALQFGTAGFEVHTARDGVDALEQARAWLPEVVVSDVLMPRLDGFRLCAALKCDPALRNVPVVLTSSAFLAPEDASVARQMGAEALIPRTPRQTELIDAARAALQAPRAPTPPSQTAALTEDYLDRICQQLEHQVRLNASLAQRLAQRRAEVAVLSAAAEAITAQRDGVVLQDVLQQAFNACGISRGAAYLVAPDGVLTVTAVLGYDQASDPGIADFFGDPRVLRGALGSRDPGVVVGVPADLDAVIVTPLRRGDDVLGVFWMEVDTTAASPEEWLPFAAAVGSQLAQAVALNRAFAAAAEGREASRREQLRREQLQIKDQFLSHVSHELRTPLTAIHQFLSILLDGLAGQVAPEQREYLQIALRNVNELRGMIDSLLEATRSETARLSLDARPVRVAEVIGDVLASLDPTARQKGVTVSTDAQIGLPLVVADPARLGQIVSNLVGNAIKFTPRGGSAVVHACVAPEDGGMLRVSVADSGPGVPPEERERIFDYLYQGQITANLARKGFGIGLHLCRDLVARQGGRIWVDSQPGRGSVFSFTIPLASQGDAAHAA